MLPKGCFSSNFVYNSYPMHTDKQYLRLFGRHIQELRKKLGISQEELAFRAGFHRTYVGMIERGERNISLCNLLRLANGLGIDIKDLF